MKIEKKPYITTLADHNNSVMHAGSILDGKGFRRKRRANRKKR